MTETRLARTPNGDLEATTRVDVAMLAALNANVVHEITQQLVVRIVDEIIATKRQEIIARIPLESIINQAVAEVVRRIAEVK